jgi:hypothetical protein
MAFININWMVFQYVVVSVNKYSGTKVKNDLDLMNCILNESLKTLGRYVFVVSDTSDTSYKERKKKNSY